MPTELCLIFTDEKGEEQQTTVNTNPFTIGRNANNDLVLADPGLSRRHALITRFDNVAQITDCGSQNGTFVNGQPIMRAVGLKNGDVISLGQACELRVQYADQIGFSPQLTTPSLRAKLSAKGNSDKTIQRVSPPQSFRRGRKFSKLSPLALATTTSLVILVMASGLITTLYFQRKPATEQQQVQKGISPLPSPKEITPLPLPSNRNLDPEAEIEKLALQVIQKISLDQNYSFRPSVLNELKQRTGKYADPLLAKALQQMREHRQEVIKQAKDLNLNPYLLSYLALAETNGGQNGNPLEVIRHALPRIQTLQVDFGGNSGDSSLLIIAAYKAPIGKTTMNNAQTDRNVWYLHKQGALSAEAYDFVLRFLAYGVIAQSPKQFSLDASILVF